MSIRLHDFTVSGHAHRVRLFLSLLGLAHETVPVDLPKGEHKGEAFLALNAFGQVPVLEDDGVALPDSNAILVYLALKHDPARRWWPEDALGAARVQRWLSVAAGQLASGVARARWVRLMGGVPDQTVIDLALHLLRLLDGQLGQQRFLASEAHPTVADIALYSYTARAPEGGMSLEPFSHIRRWLSELEALPGFLPMPSTEPFKKTP